MSNLIPLTEAEIDSIGIDHNLFMTEAINSYAFNTGNDSLEMSSDFINVGQNDLNASSDLSSMLYEMGANSDMEWERLKTDLSDSVLDIINSCRNFLTDTNNTGINYAQVNSFINQMKSTVSLNLQGKDTTIALIYLSALQKSCYLWMPQNIGGSGIGDNFINNFISSQSSQQTQNSMQPYMSSQPISRNNVNWNMVALADANGATAAYTEVEWMEILGPDGVAAMVTYISFAAAEASGASVIFQEAKHSLTRG